MSRPLRPWILFGAFDRHNFGDLLFAHLVAALEPGRPLAHAGLADRDLRGVGGHAVTALHRLAREPAWRDAALLHVGGEVLTCTAWQAAAMLLPPHEADAAIRHLEARPREQALWTAQTLGTEAPWPYAMGGGIRGAAQGDVPARPGVEAGRAAPAGPGSHRPPVAYLAAGGADLAQQSAAARAPLMAELRLAAALTVRDTATQAALAAEGLAATLLPDAAVMVAALFAGTLHRHATSGEVAAVRRRFPQGHLAVQISADYADDATLDALAEPLAHIARDTGLGLVLYRAGAAPWHDDLPTLQRLARRLGPSAAVFTSLHLWDICALIASSRGSIARSLHARIVAMAFALPRVTLGLPRGGALGTHGPPHPSGLQAGGAPAVVGGQHADKHADKHAAFIATWEPLPLQGLAPPQHLADAWHRAAAVSAPIRRATAAGLVERFRTGYAALRHRLEAAA